LPAAGSRTAARHQGSGAALCQLRGHTAGGGAPAGGEPGASEVGITVLLEWWRGSAPPGRGGAPSPHDLFPPIRSYTPLAAGSQISLWVCKLRDRKRAV